MTRQLFFLFALICYSEILAQDDERTKKEDFTLREDLIIKAQNPAGGFIFLPARYDQLFGFGPENKSIHNLTLVPVYPERLSENWGIYGRMIIPFFSAPELLSPDDYDIGLGDIRAEAFILTQFRKKIIFGPGLVGRFPTTTNKKNRLSEYGLGASFFVFAIHWPVTAGFLIRNEWSLTNNKINILFSQPFIIYNLRKGWAILSSPLIRKDWQIERGSGWILPLGGGAFKIFTVGRQPMRLGLQAFVHVARPILGPKWSFRATYIFYLDKKISKLKKANEANSTILDGLSVRN